MGVTLHYYISHEFFDYILVDRKFLSRICMYIYLSTKPDYNEVLSLLI